VRERSVHLETPGSRRAEEFLEAVRRSRALHGTLVAAPDTRAQVRAYLARIRRPTHRGYFVCLADGELAGVVNVSEIVRGALQSAYLGYYGMAAFQGRGMMREALALVLDEAFGVMGLHRLEANIQPGNGPSRALAQRLGFRQEGFSPRYLRIGGEWRDHERWAILSDDPKSGKGGRFRGR
jgi:ribosomal-protein-alanine N-acetyltransferase